MHPEARAVRLIVLNFNGDPFVHRCLQHLKALEHPADRLQIVVVDNASTDGSAERIAAEHPDVELIRRAVNNGFGANNDALRHLDGVDYVGLVNPDAFVEPGWLTPLVAVLDADPTVGAASPKILLEPTDDASTPTINNAGSILIEGGWGADRGLGQPDDGRFDEACDVFAWTGGGVLLRPDYLRDVGLFDESFFLYYEDFDLSWRGRARGWNHRYVPDARMFHLHSASTDQTSALFAHHMERNRLMMLAKNAPAGLALRAWLRFPLSTVGIARAEVLGPLLHGRRPDVTTVARRARSWAAALRRLPRLVARRREIRRRQLVDDAEILSWQVPRP